MAVEVEKLIVTLEARLANYQREMAQAQAITNRQLAAIERRYAAMSGSVRMSTSAMAIGVTGALGSISAALGLHAIQKYADSWTTVQRTIEAGREAFGVRLRQAEDLNKLANEARINNDAYTKLYVRTAAAVRELGAEEEDVAKATSTVAMALKLGTASASEQASVMLQLSQALQKGKLDGDEFRSVMENAGVIQELLAERLKVTKGEIVKMAADGKLSVQALFGALVDGHEKVARIFNRLPATIEEGFAVLNNQVEQYIGTLNNAYGGTEAFLGLLKGAGNNIETLGDRVAVLGAGLLAAFSPAIISRIVALPVALAAAAGSLGVVAGGLVGAAAAGELLGDNIAYSADGFVTLQDMTRATLEEAQKAVGELIDYATALGEQVSISGADVLDVLKTVINKYIGLGGAAYETVRAMFTKLPGAIAETVLDAVNSLIAGIQSIIDAAADGINALYNLLPGQQGNLIVAPDLGQIVNAYRGAGEAAGEAFGRAATALSTDYVAQMGANIDANLKRIEARAEELSAERHAYSGPLRRGGSDRRKPKVSSAGLTGGQDKAALKARRAFERDLIEAENKIALTRQEAELVGRTAFEIEKARTRQQLLNEARKAGVALSAADLIKVETLAEETARAVTETQALQEAYDEVRSSSQDALKGFISDLREGTSATEALGNALNRIADKLIDMAVDDLVGAALGGLTGRGGDSVSASLGSGIASLFGFAKGGVMVPGQGPATLPRFARGGISRSAAIFGEAGPEAAVPLPDGRRIPVDLRTSGAGTAPNITIAPVFNVQNGTPEGVDRLKSDMVPTIRNVVRKEVGELFDRNRRFAKSGI